MTDGLEMKGAECGRPKGNSVETRASDCIGRGMLRLELPVRRSGVS